MSFLFQIPNAILNSLWLMSILYILYLTIQYLFKLNAAKSFITLVVFEIMAAIHFLLAAFTHSHLNYTITTISIEANPGWINSTYFIGLAYLLALSIYCINLVIQCIKIAALRKNADYSIATFWHQQLHKNELNKYSIGQSNKIKSPITFGWINAVILLPISILNHLTIDEVRLILLHEIAHIIRNDFFIQVLIKICHTILLFNPFSYFFLKEINIQREIACDEWVVKYSNDPLAYSKSLYQLAKVTEEQYSPLFLNAIGSQNDLLVRIKHIHRVPVNRIDQLKQLILVITVLFISSIGFDFSSTKSIQIATQNYKNTTLITSKIQSDKKIRNSLTRIKPLIVITKLNTPFIATNPIKEEEYNAVVTNAANWIKAREDQFQNVNYSKQRDSLEFDITEKLILRSLLQNYQLRKELLNAKLATISSEKDALEYLENSKEWQEVLQYENWASTYLKKHPELSRMDSLRRF